MADLTSLDQSPTFKAFLGYGPIRPFRRDGRGDIAHAGGVTLVRSCVGQVLGTRASSEFVQGEIPWRPEFGSLLYLLRHRKNNTALGELARAWAQDALRTWEPRVRVTSVRPFRQGRALYARVVFDIIDRNVAGNNVLVAGLEIILPIAA
jgi:phage baseplate assembly protein W